jgi:hypothetical protein
LGKIKGPALGRTDPHTKGGEKEKKLLFIAALTGTTIVYHCYILKAVL